MVRFYNKRGTAEQWIKEGKQAMKTCGNPSGSGAIHDAPFTEAGYTDATGIVSRSISLLLGGLSASGELRVRR